MSKNKNKNVKKSKARMSEATKDKLKTGFLTLVNNDAAIKAGREYHWWMPVLLAIVGLVITLVPTFVSNMQINAGDSTLAANGYSVSNGLAKFQKELKEKNIDLQIGEDGILHYDESVVTPLYNAGGTDEKKAWYEATNEVGGYPQLRVLFSSDSISSLMVTTLSTYEVKTSSTITNSDGTTSEQEVSTSYRVSVLVFKESGFTFASYADRSVVTTSSAISYSYEALKGKSLLSLCPDSSVDADSQEYVTEVRNNYRNLLNKGYEATKVETAWKNVGILSGINAGIVLLLGLVLFLVTRGKNNPYRMITFWEAQKIAYWEVMAPAILSLILGFIMGSSGAYSITMFSFLFLYGMRIMWTSMKSFSPQGK